MNLFCILCKVSLLLMLIASRGFRVTAILYPQDSESRETKTLNGMWKFRTSGDEQSAGFDKKWYSHPLESSGYTVNMPVPSSYNDVYVNKTMRDYIGWVWYSRQFYVPSRWRNMLNNTQIMLRFGSVHYTAQVWVNGESVVTHVGGHLPFEGDVGKSLQFDRINLLTVAVNNSLSHHTIPPGEIQYKTSDKLPYPKGYHVQKVFFDFFNYAGIHRPVWLYTRPLVHITDITATTITLQPNNAVVSYSITTSGSSNCSVELLDASGVVVSVGRTCSGELHVTSQIHPWWPVGMVTPGNEAYLYTIKVQLGTVQAPLDVYCLKFGLRTVKITETKFLINDRPFYFMGFGRHEDSNLRGKGLDLPLVARDFSLISWVGANSFRTSHYPYAEEIMDACDEQGIVVIDECPAVGLRYYNDNSTLELHKQMLSALVSRDKNRPSVVMWSVANEPVSSTQASQEYFKAVFSHTKQLDASRPVTAVLNEEYDRDRVGQYADVICINRYYGWYVDTGHTETIYLHMTNDLAGFHKKYNKPVVVTEYGADTVAGLHREPSFIFTEEYQVDLMSETHKAFDKLRETFLVGEMIWNFADFMTDQEVNRVVGNKKGIFTRERQPKMSAHYLRMRYHKLQNQTLHWRVPFASCT